MKDRDGGGGVNVFSCFNESFLLCVCVCYCCFINESFSEFFGFVADSTFHRKSSEEKVPFFSSVSESMEKVTDFLHGL